MWVISLDWEVCPDGVELFDYGGPDNRTRLTGGPSGKYYRYRSEARQPIHYSLENLKDPIVLQFINAGDDVSLLKFLSRFGIPTGRGAEQSSKEKVSEIKQVQKKLDRLLSMFNDDDYRLAARHINMALATAQLGTMAPSIDILGDAPRMALKAQSLFTFMLMELAMAMNAQTKLAKCDHCGTAFLTGTATGRRSHAVYCSDKHRVAAMRARNAQAN